MHGIALNIDCDLSHYKNIIPCGIDATDHGVCSMQQLHDKKIRVCTRDAIQYSSSNMMNTATAGDHIDINLVVDTWIQAYVDVFSLQSAIIPTVTSCSEAERELTALLKDFPRICSSSLDII